MSFVSFRLIGRGTSVSRDVKVRLQFSEEEEEEKVSREVS